MSMRATETHSKSAAPSASEELLPYARMEQIAETKAQEYAAATPYPHIVIDDFFDPKVVERVLSEFPNKNDKSWDAHDWPAEIKLQSKSERALPLYTRQVLYAMNSSGFLKFLEKLTGIPKLLGDPEYEGGGLHQIVPGGKLAIHADFNRHSNYNLDRRLNALVYLNKNWKDEYGGHFEMWDKGMTKAEKKILPLFNRMVIFTTTDDSYHGHPDPLTCPPGMTRKSMALYYYTVSTAPAGEQERHHSTLFQERPGEKFESTRKKLARDLTPPALWRILSRSNKR